MHLDKIDKHRQMFNESIFFVKKDQFELFNQEKGRRLLLNNNNKII